MSTIHRSRLLGLGCAVVLAFTLLVPVAVTAQEEGAVPAPLAAPAVSTSGDEMRAARVLAAERALQSGDIGSMQEDRLLAVVAAAPAVASSSDEDVRTARALAAEQALQSGDIGSVQEDALTAVVEASSDEKPAPTGAELLAQLRAVELSLSRYLGTDQQVPSCAAES
jgi:hypothetical protein